MYNRFYEHQINVLLVFVLSFFIPGKSKEDAKKVANKIILATQCLSWVYLKELSSLMSEGTYSV